jgi:hypothetical protein
VRRSYVLVGTRRGGTRGPRCGFWLIVAAGEAETGPCYGFWGPRGWEVVVENVKGQFIVVSTTDALFRPHSIALRCLILVFSGKASRALR